MAGGGLQQGSAGRTVRRGRRGTAGHPMVPRPGNSRPERQNAHVRRPRLPWRPAMDAVSMSRDRIGRPRTATKPGGEGTRPKRAQQTAPERPERSAPRRWQCGVALLLQSFPCPTGPVQPPSLQQPGGAAISGDRDGGSVGERRIAASRSAAASALQAPGLAHRASVGGLDEP